MSLPNNAPHSPIDLIVLAAGKGTRLKSETPKVLQPLFDKPLLQRVLETTTTLNINKAYVVVGHQASMVTSAISQWVLPFNVDTVLQEPQLGTGHAVMQVANHCNTALTGDVLILSGDVPLLQPETLLNLIETHRQQGHHLTLLAAHLDNPTGYGRVLLNDKGQPTAIVEEKDATASQKAVQLVNAGIYCLHWPTFSPLLSELSNHNAQGEFYLTDLIHLGVKHHLSLGHAILPNAQDMIGVNTRQDLAQVYHHLNQRTMNHWMTEGVTIIDPNQTWIAPEVRLNPNTTLYPGCYLSGPVVVGNHATLGPQTTLQGNTTIGPRSQVSQSVVFDSTVGEDCVVGPFAHLRNQAVIQSQVRIGNFVEVKNSTIDSRTNVSHLSYIGDALLGKEVNIGAGTITANYNPISDTKHQTVIKDGVKVGSNAVLVAPVTINGNASIAAGSVITQDVSANALAITRPRQTEVADWVTQKKQGLKDLSQTSTPVGP